MDSLTLTIIGIMVFYLLIGIDVLRVERNTRYFSSLSSRPVNDDSEQSHDSVVYAGQGASSVPALHRVGNLIFKGNGTNPPIFNVQGEQIFEGSFGGFPVLTVTNGMVYRGQNTGGPLVATIIGNSVYRGNGASGIAVGYSPEGDQALLAILGWRS